MFGIEASIMSYAGALALVFAAVAVWGILNDHEKPWKWNVLTFIAGLVILAGMEGLTSHAKPLHLELVPSKNYTLLSYVSYPKDRIYLFMLPSNQTEPRLYSISWTKAEENKIADAVRMAEERGVPPQFWYKDNMMEPHPMPDAIELEPKDEG